MNEPTPTPPPRLGWTGLLALLGVVLVGVVLVYQAIGVVRAARVPSAQQQRSANKDQELDQAYRESFSAYLPQIKGRSLFYVPAPPTVAEASEPEDEGPAPEPPKPSSYGGPKIIAMINDEVWLEDKKRLTIGGSEGGDVRLVALSAPWSARLEWRGVEFDVPFLKRDSVVMPASKEPAAIEPSPTEGGEDEPTGATEPGGESPGKPGGSPAGSEPGVAPSEPTPPQEPASAPPPPEPASPDPGTQE